MKRILFVLLAMLPLGMAAKMNTELQSATFGEIQMNGELQTRIERNFNRLEEQKYQPDNVFLTMKQSGNWPGDTEGRTILGLVLDAQAAHRVPRFLEEIMRRIPEHLNEKGYMGPVYPDSLHEQQLSGNGWLLRGLCEYYLWKGKTETLQQIRTIVENLYMPGKGFYAKYPIDPNARMKDVGEASGATVQSQNRWMLSSDVGCVFIGMEGFLHAYQVLLQANGEGKIKIPQNELADFKSLAEEMIDRFLQIDLVGIKAQTHATLTACRGLVRFAETTGNDTYIKDAAKVFSLYVKQGMTESFGNYNWFDRFDTWTEPCAIVDSYMLAMQLWQHTQDMRYMEFAEEIYWNALCHAQRKNGGFGSDNCPGLSCKDSTLKVISKEAHWCCTMRGGEGLSRVAQYTVFKKGTEDIFLTCFRDVKTMLKMAGKRQFGFSVTTKYPFEGNASLEVLNNNCGRLRLHLPCASWMQNYRVNVNGKPVEVAATDGFVVLERNFKQGDRINVSFDEKMEFRTTLNSKNTLYPQQRCAFYGPLLLGVKGEKHLQLPDDAVLEKAGAQTFCIKGGNIPFVPVYHFMDPSVWEVGSGALQILF